MILLAAAPGSAGSLDGLKMIFQNRRHLVGRNAPEATIAGHAEVRQVLARGGNAILEAVHVMDDAEIDSRAPGPQVFQRSEECLTGIVEHRDMDPVDAA